MLNEVNKTGKITAIWKMARVVLVSKPRKKPGLLSALSSLGAHI